ncbi:hypothetical protein SUGI_1300790 [Cryptomeria japonica]|uniref:RNase H type-1 domain-containing protein n=1 Tax=Cryptomeria japonica TaxID=3369 RepID=A0AAD3NQ67_CRYJA|nr:uncharacterized protein LOC131065700 [Cryptomeria japonica]GLJ57123.1 hypothetical protein SUGI_1300790 [Cryptomeria japonica]
MERLWNLMKISSYKFVDKKQNRACTVWIPPKAGSLKVNFDGANGGNPSKLGYGAIIRDEFGNFVGANFGPLGVTSNNMAEIAGLLAGLEWSAGRGFRSLEIEGDSLIVLNGIINQKFENWKLEASRPKIQGLCDSLDRYSLKHIYREGNSAADWLANRGIECEVPTQLSQVKELPDGLISVLAADKVGIPRTEIG